jgi:CHAT domain-containing protein
MLVREFQYPCPFLARQIRAHVLLVALLFFGALLPFGTRAQSGEPARPAVPLAQPPQAAVSIDPTPLELAKPVRREIAGGQRHGFELPLEVDQAVRVDVHTDGVDLGADIVLPDGRVVPVYEPLGEALELKLPWLAQSKGTYRFEVYTRARANPGHYEIALVSRRPATPDDRDLQETRDLQAEFRRLTALGKFPEARVPLLRSLAIMERVLGPDDLQVANALGFLSANYNLTGDQARALQLKIRSVEIYEAKLGAANPAFGTELFQLAEYYANQGDYARAATVYERALAVFERAHRSESPQFATAQGMLGTTYYALGDYAAALKYFELSRTLWEKILGPDHFHLAPSYRSLGLVAYDAEDYPRARSMFERAIALNEKGMGPEHHSLTRYLNDLAMLRCTTGDFAGGENLYQRAIANHERNANLGHPAVKVSLLGLARCYAAEGKLTDAVRAQSRANELSEQYLSANLAVGSEREKLAFLSDLSSQLSRNISLHVRSAPADPLARDLAITSILQRKGRIQDTMADSLAVLRRRSAPEDRALIERLNTVNSALAKLILSPPAKTTPAERQAQCGTLEAERDSLEDQISRQTEGFYQRAVPVSLAAVRAAVPAGAALVEFAIYRPFDPGAPNNAKAFAEPRYVAYVIAHEGEVRWTDLGEAGAMDAAVAHFRQAVRDPHRRDVVQRARELDQRLMQPVRALLGDAQQVLISPDGQLNLVPFAALIDERGKFLLERYDFSYLTSGRELLRMQVARASKGRALVVANPRFGEQAANPLPSSRATRKPAAHSAVSRSSTTASDLSSVYFAPLTGTELEARSIQTQFPDAKLLLGAQATEAALKQAVAPSILHIATHGFFLAEPPGAVVPAGSRGALSASRDPYTLRLVDNLLLRSGLALADANLHNQGGDDGVLTASEAAGLNLWGTKLVVLSACDTGVGEVRTGEGVYGLRRAFVLAGAESLVMSLWPISDYTTRTMMARFYENLRQGLGRGAALRQVQLEMLHKDPHLHPFYWANFIQSGEWAGLDGSR